MELENIKSDKRFWGFNTIRRRFVTRRLSFLNGNTAFLAQIRFRRKTKQGLASDEEFMARRHLSSG